MCRPMLLLARDTAILDEHASLTHLETNVACNAALGTAVGRRFA